MKVLQLAPIKETTEDYEAIEKDIIALFRKTIYLPLIKIMGAPKSALVTNSVEDLVDAIQTGRIEFSRGQFKGRFNATTSKELKRLGAKWDRKTRTWKTPLSLLPQEIQQAIRASEVRLRAKIAGIDKTLSQILPDKIAEHINITKHFETALWKTERDFQSSVKGITIAPKLSVESRKRIAEEWQGNMKLWIKTWTEEEIIKLRTDVQKSVFTGNRYESMIGSIQKSYEVSRNKAKFLARQETSLLMTKFKETRYTEAGVKEYRWGCVAGSANHPVRPWHKALEGKVFRWDDPPITTKPGETVRRNNPGQDYNCRCFAKPIVRFRGE